jgi:hydroxyethylthiazole kinase-like uncharacterized protein yjeF
MTKAVALDRAALDAHPLPPIVDGDKETKGRVLIVAGSRQVPGAALLSALCAMRSGAGKLRIATAESVAPQIAIAMPEAYVVPLAEHRDGGLARSAVEALAKQAAQSTAIVAGPGMERSKLCGSIADALLDSPAHLVLDAALLHSLSPLEHGERPPEERPVLLPHRGELASLLDCDAEDIDADPIAAGIRAAQLYQANVLVKGVTSHVVTVEGACWTYNGGAPGLGVSGSGDTLAGIVGGLLSRGADPLTALLWGVWLHGESGAALSRKVGPIGFLAREIPDEIPALLPR